MADRIVVALGITDAHVDFGDHMHYVDVDTFLKRQASGTSKLAS